MGLLSLLQQNPALFAGLAVVLLYSVIAHEISHGLAASFYGDDTARLAGRLSLNPASHIDPMGLLMLLVAGFGWAKPVPVGYDKLRNARFAFVTVALAGPFTNLSIAFLAAAFLQFPAVHDNGLLAPLCAITLRINIMLGVFNLIPIPPLDGSKLLFAFLPDDVRQKFRGVERFGFFILIILLFTGALNPLIGFMQGVVYGLISAVFRLF
ncbi:MAG: site-2 protease family protein [Elusimicrobia bacterium]|nr:site-2 protease family protein [Elusimicrobiota bacterium]